MECWQRVLGGWQGTRARPRAHEKHAHSQALLHLVNHFGGNGWCNTTIPLTRSLSLNATGATGASEAEAVQRGGQAPPMTRLLYSVPTVDECLFADSFASLRERCARTIPKTARTHACTLSDAHTRSLILSPILSLTPSAFAHAHTPTQSVCVCVFHTHTQVYEDANTCNTTRAQNALTHTHAHTHTRAGALDSAARSLSLAGGRW